jgi:hypothetical protein
VNGVLTAEALAVLVEVSEVLSRLAGGSDETLYGGGRR